MRQPFVAGNWKLNGSRQSVHALIEGLKNGMLSVNNAQVVVCPPSIYIPQCAELLKGSAISLGAQNVCEKESGAYTGEISSAMLKEFACEYAIIGHSERRSIYGESDELVAEKVAAAEASGLTPILCVGELLEEREANQTEAVVSRQIDAVLANGGMDLLGKCIIAYEPVWAIGTGKTASPEQAQEVHAFIRNKLRVQDQNIAESIQIIYGGSVKSDNAKELFSMEDIDGGLIGGASLDAESFIAICAAANK